MSVDFTPGTETPDTLVSAEALDMVRTRYDFAAEHCVGKSVLEVACGPGTGLGYLAERSRTLVAGDYMAHHPAYAQAHYGSRIPLIRLDALHLPFRPSSFDVVVLFEALYFLPSFETFLKACREVLSNEGVLLIATANPEWSDFQPAPLSTRYLSATELEEVLRVHRFTVALYGGFRVPTDGLRARLIGMVKRAAVKLHLIPKTMKGKQLLKRIAFGRLSPFPAEVSSSTGTVHPPARLSRAHETAGFRVIYAVARKEAN
jgi:SAM-dependent methyltransferase